MTVIAAAVLGCQLAGLLLYAIESVELLLLDPTGFKTTARQALLILCTAGTVLGVVLGCFEALRLFAQPRVAMLARPHAFYCALVLPPAYLFGRQLFSGAWISRQPYAPLGPAIVVVLAAFGVAATLALLARVSSRSLAASATASAALGCAALYLDRSFAKDLYVHAHAVLIGLAAIAFAGSFGMAVRAALRRWPERTPLALLVAAVLASSIPLTVAYGPTAGHRLFWDALPGYTGRIYEGARRLAFLYAIEQQSGGEYLAQVGAWLEQRPDLKAVPPHRYRELWRRAVRRAQRDGAVRAGRSGASSKPHIVLITVDTLRADVAYAGAGSSNSPRLMREGVVFQRAYAPSASTKQSIPIMLSGRTDWRQHQDSIILALNEAGYQSAFLADRQATLWLKTQDQLWLEQPSAIVTVDSKGGTSSREITLQASRLLRERPLDRPLFLWIHYFDMHEWREHAAPGDDPEASYLRLWALLRGQLDDLLDAIRATLPPDRTFIVFAADHGEYLGEMGRLNHGRWVAPELVRVPLVVVAPGRAPSQVLEPVGLVDIAPTLAEIAGLQLEDTDGVSLLSATATARALRPLAMAEDLELGVVLGDHRLVLDPARNLLRLFDDSAAPRELPSGAHRELVDRLLRLLLGSPAVQK